MDPELDRNISDHVLRMHRYRNATEQDGDGTYNRRTIVCDKSNIISHPFILLCISNDGVFIWGFYLKGYSIILQNIIFN